MADDFALDPPHPRARHELVGQDRAARTLLDAEASGRLHHAWLIGGPRGIGKATLAYRFARWLLASPQERHHGIDGLAVDPAGRTARQVAASSHPNLMTLELPAAAGDKAAPKTIPVEAVRRVLGFFGTTAADGGRRICVVDAVDELAAAGANALLKTVEEPPPASLILLVSHAPQRVLQTIRSRCRKLSATALGHADVGRVLSSLEGGASAEADLVRRAARASEGSVRRGLALLDPRRLKLLDDVEAALDGLPGTTRAQILALADRLGDRRAEADYELALDVITRWVSDRISREAGRGPARLAPLAEAAIRMAEASRMAEAYNLDRKPFLLGTFEDLADAVRRAA